MEHLLDDLIGHRGDVRTGQGAVRHMDGIAHAGGDDLRLNVRVVQEHIVDGFHQLNARLADVIQPPQKRADVSGSGAGGQQGLVGAEDQRAVGGDTLGRQHLDGLEALGGHGDLHDHVGGVQRVDGAALGDHAFGVGGGGLHLAGDGAIHDGGDLGQGLGVVAALLGNQAGVGSDTGDNAHVVGLADLLYIGSVNEKFHGMVPPLFTILLWLLQGRPRARNASIGPYGTPYFFCP